MAPFQPKTTTNSNKNIVIPSGNVDGSTTTKTTTTTTLYSQISEIQPIDLLQRLDKEGISTRGDMPGLRARLLRHELRKIYPETNAALHKDLELTGREAENWCAMMHLWEIDMRARIKMREQQERSCLMVDRKLDDAMATQTNKPFENDVAEKNRVDYLLSCEKLLRSWQLEYSGGAKGQTAKEFLESLNDFRKFAEIGDQVLLLMLPSVLKNDMRAWYRTKTFATWAEFETAFIQYTIMSTRPRAAAPVTSNFANKGPQQPTPNSTTMAPQFPTHAVQSDVNKPNVEGRMTQSFSLGIADTSVYREQHKPQKGVQEQVRPQLFAPTAIRRSSEDERRRLREHELYRARYIEYLQQSRLECTKERFQPHTNVRAKCESVKNQSDKSTETSSESSHVECVKKLRLWNVKYSGEKGRAVIEFMDDLMDFRKYANVSDDVLLDVLPCVLSGSAKSWYRRPSLLIERWTTWEEFKEEFLKRFYDSVAAEEGLKRIIDEVQEL